MSEYYDDEYISVDQLESSLGFGVPDEECPARDGYFSHGRDLADHAYWEHRECDDCGARPQGRDSLTHQAWCPRLQPGHAYPPRET